MSSSRRARDGLLQRVADDPLADPVDLEVELNARDAALRAGDLEIHVAEMVLVPHDVGEQRVLVVRLLDQADRDAGHRLGDRHAGIHHRPAWRCTRVAIELEPLDSMMSEIMRIV